jgi:hypothetical protein
MGIEYSWATIATTVKASSAATRMMQHATTSWEDLSKEKDDAKGRLR